MSSTYALQPLEKSQIPKLLETLESLLPDSIIAYNWLLNGSKWIDGPGIETKILILCPNGETIDGSMVGLIHGLAGNNKIFGTVYAQTENLEKMQNAIMETEHIKWERLKHVRVWSRFVPHLAKIMKTKGIKFAESYRNVYATTSLQAASLPSPTIPNDVRIGKLDETHLDVFCEHWPAYDIEFRPVVMKMLQCNPSVGIFVKTEPISDQETLASMVMQTDYGGIGLLQTIPEHQRKGYGKIVVATLAKSLAARNIMPFAFILIENDSSSALFKKLGFEEIGVMCKIVLTSD